MRRGLILKIGLGVGLILAGSVFALNSYVRYQQDTLARAAQQNAQLKPAADPSETRPPAKDDTQTTPATPDAPAELVFHALDNVQVTSGVAGFLRAGDRVDLYVTNSQGITSLLVANARLAGVSSGGPDEDRSQAVIQMDLAFRLTPDQLQALNDIAPGSVVSLSLIGAEDDVVTAAVEVDQRDLLGIETGSKDKTDSTEIAERLVKKYIEHLTDEERKQLDGGQLGTKDLMKLFARQIERSGTRGVQIAGSGTPGKTVANSPTAPDPAKVLVDQLKAADLAFNRPSRMQFGTAVRVELVLAPKEVSGLAALPETASVQARAEAVGLTAELAGETRVVEDVRFATRMQAVLAGPDFDVDPPGAQARTVLPDASAKWVWTVKPKAHGEDKLLTLDVQAIVERNGQDMPPAQIRVFREVVPVDISVWGRLVLMSAEIKAVHGMLAALGGTALAGVGWLWRRRKGKTPAPKPDPVEVIVTHRSET